MKKRWIWLIAALCAVLLIVLCVVLVCAGRDDTASYTYSVDNGDYIVLTLDTSDGYDLSYELPFSVTRDGEEQCTGQFLYMADGEDFINSAKEGVYTIILESGEKDGNQYLFWTYRETEYNYAVLINNSNTAVVIGNTISEESARECFARLTFSVKQ